MDGKNIKYRIGKSYTAQILTTIFAFACVIPLLFILFYILKAGITKINWHFLVNVPKPVGEPGGGIQSLDEALGHPAQFQQRAHAVTLCVKGWKQRTCLPATGLDNAGSFRQVPSAREQRSRKAQPGARSSSDGVIPGICRNGSPLRLRLGTESMSPCV